MKLQFRKFSKLMPCLAYSPKGQFFFLHWNENNNLFPQREIKHTSGVKHTLINTKRE